MIFNVIFRKKWCWLFRKVSLDSLINFIFWAKDGDKINTWRRFCIHLLLILIFEHKCSLCVLKVSNYSVSGLFCWIVYERNCSSFWIFQFPVPQKKWVLEKQNGCIYFYFFLWILNHTVVFSINYTCTLCPIFFRGHRIPSLISLVTMSQALILIYW